MCICSENILYTHMPSYEQLVTIAPAQTHREMTYMYDYTIHEFLGHSGFVLRTLSLPPTFHMQMDDTGKHVLRAPHGRIYACDM